MKVKQSTVVVLSAAAAIAALTAWAYFRPIEADSKNSEAPTAATPTASSAPSAIEAPTASHGAIDHRSGDSQVAAQFEQSRRCYFLQGHATARKSATQACKSLSKAGRDETEVATCLADLEKGDPDSQNEDRDLAQCPADAASGRRFYEATKTAASQGNADAQACYVQHQFLSNGTALTYSQQEISDYVRDAPHYISDGLARGDWRIVSLLARGGHDDTYSPLSLVTKDNIYTQYVMNRLLQLGADRAYAQQLETSIQVTYLSPGISTAPPLTQQQITDGKAEAQSFYHKSFDQEPMLTGPPLGCPKG